MNKHEFIIRAKIEWDDISEKDWNAINTVYAWHPMISDTKGKDEIATLYKRGGMGIIFNMLDTASELEFHNSNIQANSVKMEKLEKEQKAEMDQLITRQRVAVQDIKNDTITANDCIRTIEASFKIK